MTERSARVDDFLISATEDGLRVEVLDYHAGALLLSRDTLRSLGYVSVRGGEAISSRARRRPSTEPRSGQASLDLDPGDA